MDRFCSLLTHDTKFNPPLADYVCSPPACGFLQWRRSLEMFFSKRTQTHQYQQLKIKKSMYIHFLFQLPYSENVTILKVVGGVEGTLALGEQKSFAVLIGHFLCLCLHSRAPLHGNLAHILATLTAWNDRICIYFSNNTLLQPLNICMHYFPWMCLRNTPLCGHSFLLVVLGDTWWKGHHVQETVYCTLPPLNKCNLSLLWKYVTLCIKQILIIMWQYYHAVHPGSWHVIGSFLSAFTLVDSSPWM